MAIVAFKSLTAGKPVWLWATTLTALIGGYRAQHPREGAVVAPLTAPIGGLTLVIDSFGGPLGQRADLQADDIDRREFPPLGREDCRGVDATPGA